MSQGINYLHSHSLLERSIPETAKDKFHVLVDEEYIDIFKDCTGKITPFFYNRKKYYKVPTYDFFRKGGVFKCLGV